jgi:hypothetical protein
MNSVKTRKLSTAKEHHTSTTEERPATGGMPELVEMPTVLASAWTPTLLRMWTPTNQEFSQKFAKSCQNGEKFAKKYFYQSDSYWTIGSPMLLVGYLF